LTAENSLLDVTATFSCPFWSLSHLLPHRSRAHAVPPSATWLQDSSPPHSLKAWARSSGLYHKIHYLKLLPRLVSHLPLVVGYEKKLGFSCLFGPDVGLIIVFLMRFSFLAWLSLLCDGDVVCFFPCCHCIRNVNGAACRFFPCLFGVYYFP